MSTDDLQRPLLTALYVPGDRPDRFAKALASGADVVMLDLEDAVAPANKAAARAAVAEALVAPSGDGPQLHVRVNGTNSPWWSEDAAMLRDLRPAGIKVPKVESADQVRAVADLLLAQHATLHCLIESARGVEAAFEIASAHPSVASIGLGEADLASDLGTADEDGLLWARSRIVVAARAAGLPSPMMSVWAKVADLDGLAASCRRGRALGFLGRSAIHPSQIPVIVDAFTPSAEEVARAKAVLDGLVGGGVALLADGRMVDAAMVALARRTLLLGQRPRRTNP